MNDNLKLIKIKSDGVEIKTNSQEFENVKINDLLKLKDQHANIVCIVTALKWNDLDPYALPDDPYVIIECGIIGSITNGKFSKTIDVYPSKNVQIEFLSENEFSEMLSGETESCLKLGKYTGYDCQCNIDANKFFQRHNAILGNTGSGKSWCISSILEKMAESKGFNVILFDLHGEYSNLSFVDEIKIGNDGIKFPIWFLSFRDIYSSILKMKDETSINQIAVLRRCFYEIRNSNKSEEVPVPFDYETLIDRISIENEDLISTGEFYKTGEKAGQPKTVKGENNGKLTSLISLLKDKLTDTNYNFLFGNEDENYFKTFAKKLYGIENKNIKVINLSNVPYDVIPIIISVITKLVYNIHLQQDRENILPISIICDEAHNYIPSSDFGIGASQRRLLEVFEKIAKEGRKFGATLTVVSQRPSELNKTILAQCANFIVLKVSNDTDLQIIKTILPENTKEIVNMLSLFSPGDCFVIGDSAKITVKAKIDLPSQAPNSNTLDFWNIWKTKNELNVDLLVENLLEEKTAN